jgi:uncharacterized membrane protein YjfL (UPF0719 family)
MFNLEASLLLYYLIDFLVVLVILAGFRWFSDLLANASLREILAEQDNFAVGISLSGALIGIGLMLMGAVSGKAAATPLQELASMAAYGGLGVALMWLTRLLFDYAFLREISIHRLLQARNVAAGLVDAGHMIAVGIIVRAVMIWVEGDPLIGALAVLGGFLVSQLILYLATFYRNLSFARRHPGDSLQAQIERGNMAVAVRFAGHGIGVALAVTATSGLVLYNQAHLPLTLGLWFAVALGLFAAQTLIALVARAILLPGVNIGAEITEQRNVAIGALEAAIHITVGLVFAGLLA